MSFTPEQIADRVIRQFLGDHPEDAHVDSKDLRDILIAAVRAVSELEVKRRRRLAWVLAMREPGHELRITALEYGKIPEGARVQEHEPIPGVYVLRATS